ncbi:hypothetical protein LTR05_008824, partial [Lithohypha guttulata]
MVDKAHQDSLGLSLPLRNSALWFHGFGNPVSTLSLEETELGPCPPSQIRVCMTAAPVNPSDIIPITGAYRHTVKPPRVAGYEGVGTVVQADGSSKELLDRRVLPLRGAGTWQSYVDCDPVWAVPVPDDIDDRLAVQGYINPLAAYLMLKQWPVRGRRVLLTGAGSACAGLLAQWAFDAGATEVIGVYRSQSHVARLIKLGVRPISIYSTMEIQAVSLDTDIVFDAVGGS